MKKLLLIILLTSLIIYLGSIFTQKIIKDPEELNKQEYLCINPTVQSLLSNPIEKFLVIKTNIIKETDKYTINAYTIWGIKYATIETNSLNCGTGAKVLWRLLPKQGENYPEKISETEKIAQKDSETKAEEKIKEVEKSFGIQEVNNTINTKDYLQGKWQSLDDEDSQVEFTKTQKIDYYTELEMSRASFTIDEENSKLIVNSDSENMEYIINKISDSSLELIYSPRGNTLKYKKI